MEPVATVVYLVVTFECYSRWSLCSLATVVRFDITCRNANNSDCCERLAAKKDTIRGESAREEKNEVFSLKWLRHVLHL